MAAINFHKVTPEKIIAKAKDEVIIDVEFEVMDPLYSDDYMDMKLIFIPADEAAIEAR